MKSDSEPPAGPFIENPSSGGFIELESAQAFRDTLLFRLSFHERLDPYLTTGLFYARYDFPVEPVPMSILSIPLLGFLTPLGWLTGAEIRVGDVDEAYLNSLSSVTQEFKRMFPQISFSGRIRANPVRVRSEWDQERYCLLFSSGVDATSSLIRNLGKKPSLLTVKGTPDVPLHDDQYWERVRERIQPFVGSLGIESHVVETNALDMVNLPALSANFRGKLRIGWWEDLAHGLFLLSLCAPYTFINQIGSVMIASSYTAKTQVPWGSSPMTDEKVRWGGIRVIHDSYDLSRRDKISQVLIPFANRQHVAVPLRVCTGRRAARLAGGQLNCGQCPKCMVVELILILSGADASESGFDISPPALSALKSNLEAGLFGREYDEPSWDFIKENAKSPPREILGNHPGLAEFFAWFADWDEKPTKKRRRFVDLVAPPASRRRDVARAAFGRGENQKR